MSLLRRADETYTAKVQDPEAFALARRSVLDARAAGEAATSEDEKLKAKEALEQAEQELERVPEFTVVLRRLNALDEAALLDAIRLSIDGDDDDANLKASIPIGTRQMLTVQRAVVSWDHPTDPHPTPEIIAQLHPDVFDQIYAAIEEMGDELKQPTPEANPTPASSEAATKPTAEPEPDGAKTDAASSSDEVASSESELS